MKKAQRTADYYNKQSHKYDRIYRSYLRHTHDKLLDEIQLEAGDSVLDCSAGTGLLAEDLIQKVNISKFVLNDPADRMLNVAKKKLKFTETEIAYTNLFAEELGQLLPEKFDHIICLNSFHYYVDQEKVLHNFQQLLKPGGTLWLLDWNRKGLFIINSKLIDWFSSMNINTRTLAETESMLKTHGLSIKRNREWRYRLWNFFYLKASLT